MFPFSYNMETQKNA